MIERTTSLLHLLVDGMRSTRVTELQYQIQRMAPALLQELDRAQALRKNL